MPDVEDDFQDNEEEEDQDNRVPMWATVLKWTLIVINIAFLLGNALVIILGKSKLRKLEESKLDDLQLRIVSSFEFVIILIGIISLMQSYCIVYSIHCILIIIDEIIGLLIDNNFNAEYAFALLWIIGSCGYALFLLKTKFV